MRGSKRLFNRADGKYGKVTKTVQELRLQYPNKKGERAVIEFEMVQR